MSQKTAQAFALSLFAALLMTAYAAPAQAGFYVEGSAADPNVPPVTSAPMPAPEAPSYILAPSSSQKAEPMMAPAYPAPNVVTAKKTPQDLFPVSEKSWLERQWDLFNDWTVRVVNGDSFSDNSADGYPRRNVKSSLDREDLGEK